MYQLITSLKMSGVDDPSPVIGFSKCRTKSLVDRKCCSFILASKKQLQICFPVGQNDTWVKIIPWETVHLCSRPPSPPWLWLDDPSPHVKNTIHKHKNWISISISTRKKTAVHLLYLCWSLRHPGMTQNLWNLWSIMWTPKIFSTISMINNWNCRTCHG